MRTEYFDRADNGVVRERNPTVTGDGARAVPIGASSATEYDAIFDVNNSELYRRDKRKPDAHGIKRGERRDAGLPSPTCNGPSVWKIGAEPATCRLPATPAASPYLIVLIFYSMNLRVDARSTRT